VSIEIGGLVVLTDPALTRRVAHLRRHHRVEPATMAAPDVILEAQVGSHGGLGGPQTRPFLLHPIGLSDPPAQIFTGAELHRVLKTWLAELGQPVVRPWLADGAAPTISPTRS
jgi:hypothetical protein